LIRMKRGHAKGHVFDDGFAVHEGGDPVGG
jgi:hypothetical protein